MSTANKMAMLQKSLTKQTVPSLLPIKQSSSTAPKDEKEQKIAAIDAQIKQKEAEAVAVNQRTDLTEYQKRLATANINNQRNELVQEKIAIDPNIGARLASAAGNIVATSAGGMTAASEVAKDVLSGNGASTGYDPDSKSAQYFDYANKAKETALSGTTGATRWLGEVALGVGQSLSTLPLAVISPALPAVAMGLTAAGSKAAEVKQQGGTSTKALFRGLGSGVIEGVTEQIPISTLFDAIKVGGKSAVKSVLKQAGIEASEEGLSYTLNYLADKIAKDPNATFSLKELANAVGMGAASGGIMGTSAVGISMVNGSNVATPEAKAQATPNNELPDIFAETTSKDQNIADDQIKVADDIVEPVAEKPVNEAVETINSEPADTPTSVVEQSSVKPTDQVSYGDNTVGSAEARFKYKEAPTQSVANDMFTNEEKREHNLENTHKVYTNAESRYDAQERLEFDYEGEKSSLENEEWGAAETVMGYQILDDLVAKARKTGDWSEVKRWKNIYDQKGTVEGQALQARKQFSGTTAEIVSEAAQNMDSQNLRKLNPQKKAQLLDDVYNQAEAYNKIGKGDTESLIKLIERNSEIRRTTGFFSKKTSKQMDWALHQIADKYPDAEQFLRDVAVAQIRNITSDYNKVGVTEAMKSIRIMNLLSKFSTVMRNLVSNNIFDPLESLSNNVGLIADSIMSLSTGNRTTAFDRSWASKEKRAGSLEGALKSFVEIGLDAPTEDATSRYEGTGSGRTFKMTGNALERLLSTWSKYENYTLQTTDEFQKGGVRAETQRQIDSLKASGKLGKDALSEWADETAKQRTFQNDSALTKAMEGVKGGLNKLHVGSIGAGDILQPFARIAGNLATQSVNYSPNGFINSLRQVVTVMAKAKSGNVDPATQAQAARNFGRGVTGTALLAGVATLAVKGLIDVAGDDDKDKEALEKAQGKTGTQLNLSATLRFLDGGDAEWKDGDTIVSIGFLDPINSIMAAASLIADEYEADEKVGFLDVLGSSFGGIWQSILDLPVMTSVSDLITTYEYAEGETAGDKALNAAVDYAGSQASSFVVPNILRGVATGMDDTVRNQYTGETLGKSILDSIVSGIPGLRSTLPASLDPFGREKTQTGDDFLNFVNNSILPGQVSKYKLTDIEAEIESVYNKTGDTTLYPDKNAPNSVLYDNQKYTLDAEQKQNYQKTLGSTYIDTLSDMIESDLYKNASESQKAEYIGIAKDYATAVAKKDVVGADYKMDSILARSERAEVDFDISQSEFLMLYSTLNGEKPNYDADDNDAYSNAEIANAIKATGFPKEDQTIMWLIENPEWGDDADKYGVEASLFVDFKVATMGIKADRDKNGKAISGSAKEKTLKAINGLNASKREKDKLYLAAGYAESGLNSVPWR